jgi:hypothetical protein
VRSLRYTALAAITVVIVAIGASSANAAGSSNSDVATSSTTSTAVPAGAIAVPMTVSGYDKATAAANGYDIRFNADGTPYSVPVGTPKVSTSTQGITPFSITNPAVGDCGVSWVYIFDKEDPRAFKIVTGFTVGISAVSYGWSVNVVGPAFNKTHIWSGGLLFRTGWEGTWTQTVSLAGTYSSNVISGTVLLANGIYCESLHPIDNIVV